MTAQRTLDCRVEREGRAHVCSMIIVIIIIQQRDEIVLRDASIVRKFIHIRMDDLCLAPWVRLAKYWIFRGETKGVRMSCHSLFRRHSTHTEEWVKFGSDNTMLHTIPGDELDFRIIVDYARRSSRSMGGPMNVLSSYRWLECDAISTSITISSPFGIISTGEMEEESVAMHGRYGCGI